MDAEKSLGVPGCLSWRLRSHSQKSANWRPRRVSDLSSSLNQKIQKPAESKVWIVVQGQETVVHPQANKVPSLALFFISGFQMTEWGPQRVERIIHSTWSNTLPGLTIKMLISLRNTLPDRHTDNVWPNVCIVHCPVKLIRQISHHFYKD